MEREFILARIRELLEERDWPLSRLTEKTTLNYGVVNSWFNSKSKFPSLKSLCEVCDAFGISLSAFFAPLVGECPDKRAKVCRLLYEINNEQLEVAENLIKAFIKNNAALSDDIL